MSINRTLVNKYRSGEIFDSFNYVFMILLSLTIIYPFWNVLLLSFQDATTATTLGIKIWNKQWFLNSYQYIFRDSSILVSYRNTILRTVIGTALTVAFTLAAAYPLSKKELPGRKQMTAYYLVTMFFSGGLIPTFLLVRSLGMIDKFWVYIIPGMLSAFYILIMRNFLMSIDKGIEESALIDGAGYLTILWRIIIPLSKPIIATIALWTAVGHWNSWFDALIYTRSPSLSVLQLVLRKMVVMTEGDSKALIYINQISNVKIHTASVKSATIIITIGPIIVLYPFLQKYFIKGIMLGALKG